MKLSSSDLPLGSGAPARRVVDLSVLTRAERDIVGLALAGLSVRQMSERLVVSESTVHTHLTHIYRKLGVKGRVDLLALAATLQETPERPVEVASLPVRRAIGLEAGVAIAISGVLVALVLPVAAFAVALALLAAASLAGRRKSLGVEGARVPLLLGGLVCVLVGLAGFLLPRVV